MFTEGLVKVYTKFTQGLVKVYSRFSESLAPKFFFFLKKSILRIERSKTPPGVSLIKLQQGNSGFSTCSSLYRRS